MKRLLLICGLALALAPAASAAKPAPAPATLQTSCSVCLLASPDGISTPSTIVTFSGSGYDPRQNVQLQITGPNGTWTIGGFPPNPDGTVSYSAEIITPGTYTAVTLQTVSKWRWQQMASTSFSVS